MAYRLELPTEAMIHNVFHISQLKKCVGPQTKIQNQPSDLSDGFKLQMDPESVLGVRWKNELYKEEWLVKWRHYPKSEATWEIADALKEQFPHLHLEGKVNFERKGGIVRPPIIHTYKRGKKGNSLIVS